MKLHLHKALYMAVLAASSSVVMAAVTGTQEFLSENSIITSQTGEKYFNLGTCTNDYDHINYTWLGDLTVGSGRDSSGTVDKIGAFDDDGNMIQPNGMETITNHLNVTGNVTVQGEGQLVLGGHGRKWSSDSGKYMGLEAKSLTVNGGLVDVTKLSVDVLSVTGGKVNLMNTPGCASQASSGMGPTTSSTKANNQTHIKSGIVLAGGDLCIGNAAASYPEKKGGNFHHAFGVTNGSFSIEQTGGNMTVYGNVVTLPTATITQSGNAGDLIFRDTLYLTEGCTTTSINQESDTAKLVIGKLEMQILSAGNHSVNFNQSGEGLIHLAYGTTSGSDNGERNINFNQSGGGDIVIGGGHTEELVGELPEGYQLSGFDSSKTTYNIEQSDKGGSVVLESNASIKANRVQQTTSAAELMVKSGAELSVTDMKTQGTVDNAGTVKVGSLEVSDGVFNNTGTVESLADSDAMLQTIIVSGQGEYQNFGTTELGILVENGGSVTLGADSSVGAIEMNNGNITVAGDSTTGSLTLNGGTITFENNAAITLQQGATVSLSGVDIVIAVSSDTLAGLAEGFSYQLFDGDSDTSALDNSQITFTDGTERVTAVVSGAQEGGKVTVSQVIPEPTTATLSLLALAALAARRRRR